MHTQSAYDPPGMPVSKFVQQYLDGRWETFVAGMLTGEVPDVALVADVPTITPQAFRLWELCASRKPRTFNPAASVEAF
ncbi:hypothetical protein ACMDCR_32430 [Labrys okinawensis]|uniref:hypothetical protein n=1 Tax=Labrys okinawensis TaxID=346911 RepID=UPI0039BC4872